MFCAYTLVLNITVCAPVVGTSRSLRTWCLSVIEGSSVWLTGRPQRSPNPTSAAHMITPYRSLLTWGPLTTTQIIITRSVCSISCHASENLYFCDFCVLLPLFLFAYRYKTVWSWWPTKMVRLPTSTLWNMTYVWCTGTGGWSDWRSLRRRCKSCLKIFITRLKVRCVLSVKHTFILHTMCLCSNGRISLFSTRMLILSNVHYRLLCVLIKWPGFSIGSKCVSLKCVMHVLSKMFQVTS